MVIFIGFELSGYNESPKSGQKQNSVKIWKSSISASFRSYHNFYNSIYIKNYIPDRLLIWYNAFWYHFSVIFIEIPGPSARDTPSSVGNLPPQKL